MVGFKDVLNDLGFGKGFVIILRAEDAALEIGRKAEQFGFVLHILMVGAAGEVKLKTAVRQVVQQCQCPGRHQVMLVQRAGPEPFLAGGDVGVEQIVEPVLVDQRLPGRAAPAFDLLTEPDHLIDGLLAGQFVHKIGDQLFKIGIGLARVEFGQDLDHHGNHDLPPAGSARACRQSRTRHSRTNPV